jgi:hypothetical protein
MVVWQVCTILVLYVALSFFPSPHNISVVLPSGYLKKYHCAICDLVCATNSKLQRHCKTERHIEKAAKAVDSMT